MSAQNGLTYRILTEDDYVNVLQFAQKHFIPFEPLLIAARVTAEEEINFPHVMIKNSLWQRVSIGVFDNNTEELCAVRLNMLAKLMKSSPYDDNYSMHTEKMCSVMRILCYINEGLERYFPNDNFMEHVFVVVNQAYSRRGIATELYRRSEILAREHGCNKMKVTCSNFYTRRSVEKVGYVLLREMNYVDYEDVTIGQKPFAKIKAPHTSITVLMKSLEKD